MNRYIHFSPAIIAAICMFLTMQALPAENRCVSCHQQSEFYARYPKLYEYYQQWLESPHYQVGVSCDDCHGGDRRIRSAQEAHVGIFPISDRRSALHFKNQPETCGQCHNDKRSRFVESKHFEALVDQRAAPTCTTCHPAMSQRPEYKAIVLNACRNCHGEGNSENLPLITERAEDVFNQLNIARGFLGWTRIHFESRGWPEDSKQQVRDLDERYRTVLDQVHEFDLQQTDEAMIEILGELKAVFEQARRTHEQRVEEQTEAL